MLSVRLLEFLSVRKWRDDLPAMRSLVDADSSGALLDIGGGGGSVTSTFVGNRRLATVVDPNLRKIRVGARRHRGIRFVRGRAEALPFVDGSFGLVTAVVSLHHADALERALSEIGRVLAPHGRVIIHELYPGRDPGVVARWIARRFHGSPPHFMAPEALSGRLEAHGLHVEPVRDGIRGYFVAAKGGRSPQARAGSEI